MKSSSTWTIALVLIGTSLLGLLLTAAFNLLAFGRPDQALLDLLASVSRYAIDCEHPQDSKLFNENHHSASDSRLQALNWILYDSQGKILAFRGNPSDIPGLASPTDLENLATSPIWQVLASKSKLWARQDEICGQGLSLLVNDRGNKVFRSLILRRQSSLFLLSSSSLIAVVLGFWWYLRRKGQEATRVLRQFANGDRQARIPVKTWEQSFELIHEFNRMAEKLVQLLEHVESLEGERSRILSELAHDIRTPLASLLSGLETLSEFRHEMTAEQEKRLLFNLNEDAAYFRRLIDDLFLLAAIDSDVKRQGFQKVDLAALVRHCWSIQWENADDRLQRELAIDATCESNAILEGESDLLRRMLLNLLENARRYALSRVRLELRQKDNAFYLIIRNDADDAVSGDLVNWGKKRQRRMIRDDPANPHTSLGLGSSIACQIAQAHGGQAWVEDEKAADKTWVEVHVYLPCFSALPG